MEHVFWFAGLDDYSFWTVVAFSALTLLNIYGFGWSVFLCLEKFTGGLSGEDIMLRAAIFTVFLGLILSNLFWPFGVVRALAIQIAFGQIQLTTSALRFIEFFLSWSTLIGAVVFPVVGLIIAAGHVSPLAVEWSGRRQMARQSAAKPD